MSTVVDNKVVELSLNNGNFEKNAKDSIETLQRLQYALNISTADTNKQIENVNKTLIAMPLDKIASGVDNITNRFNILGQIGFSVINNLTNRLTNMVTSTTWSMTMGQKQAGWGEYQLKMNATKTIMSGSGEELEKVNEELEKLNAYADKTIYSFSDMTQNIGKFTNAGVELEKAVGAIQGVSSLAAVSGQGAAEASRAMYNFAQALSTGYLGTLDWRSIETANMATVEFKNELIKTGVAMGTLVKQGDKYVSTTTNANGAISKSFDAMTGFRDALQNQWITADVLTETLARYSDETTDIGKKAMSAATEVKTLSVMMDSLREASGSGWAHTFEMIFGNLEEGTALWTYMYNKLEKLLNKFTEARNAPLEYWKKSGGRDMLGADLRQIGKLLSESAKPIQEAWQKIFPPKTQDWILRLTQNFDKFVMSLKTDNEVMHATGQIFELIFRLIRIGINSIKGLFKSLKIFNPGMKSTGEIIRYLYIELGKLAEKANNFLNGAEKAITFADIFTIAFGTIIDTLKDLGKYMGKAGESLLDFLGIWKKTNNTVENDANKRINSDRTPIGSALALIRGGSNDDIPDGAEEEKSKNAFQKWADKFLELMKAIRDFFVSDLPSVDANSLLSDIKNSGSIGYLFVTLLETIKYVFSVDFITDFRDWLKIITSTLIDTLLDIYEYIRDNFIQVVTLTTLIMLLITGEKFAKSAERASSALMIKAIANFTEVLNVVLTNILKLLLAFTAMKLLLGNDFNSVINTAVSAVKDIFSFLFKTIAFVTTIALIYGPVMSLVNKTKKAKAGEKILDSLKSIGETYSQNKVLWKIIDETSDIAKKMSNAMIQLAVAATIIAAGRKKYKNFDETFDQVLDFYKTMITIVLSFMAVIVALSAVNSGLIAKGKDNVAGGIMNTIKVVTNCIEAVSDIFKSLSNAILKIVTMATLIAVTEKVLDDPGAIDDALANVAEILITMLAVVGVVAGSALLLQLLLSDTKEETTDLYSTDPSNITKSKKTIGSKLDTFIYIIETVTEFIEKFAKTISGLLTKVAVIAVLTKIIGEENIISAMDTFERMSIMIGVAAVAAVTISAIIANMFKDTSDKSETISGKNKSSSTSSKSIKSITTVLESITNFIKTFGDVIVKLVGTVAIIAAVSALADGLTGSASGTTFDRITELIDQVKWFILTIGAAMSVMIFVSALLLNNDKNGQAAAYMKAVASVISTFVNSLMIALAVVTVVAGVIKSANMESIFNSVFNDLFIITVGLAVIVGLIAGFSTKASQQSIDMVKSFTGIIYSFAVLMAAITVPLVLLVDAIGGMNRELNGLDIAAMLIPFAILSGIVLIVAGLLALSKSINATQLVKVNDLVAVVLVITAAMSVITADLIALTNFGGGPGALLAGAGALVIMALAITGAIAGIMLIAKTASSTSWGSIGKILVLLASVVGSLVILSQSIIAFNESGITPGELLKFVGVIAVLGTVLMLFTAVAGLLSGLAASALPVVGVILGIALAIAGVNLTLGYLVKSITVFLAFITDNASELAPALISMAAAIGQAVGVFFETIITSIANAISKIPLIAYAIIKAFVDTINTIAANLGEVMLALHNLLISFINAVGDELARLPELIEVVQANAIKVAKAWVDALLKQLGLSSDDIFKASKAMGKNIVDGLANVPKEIAKTAAKTGTSFINSIKSVLGIHSPSKVMKNIGKFLTKGLSNGIDSGIDEVDSVINTLVGTIKSGFYGADLGAMLNPDGLTENLSGITGSLTDFANGTSGIFGDIGKELDLGGLMNDSGAFDDISKALDMNDILGADALGDINPTITPVVDLSNVENSVGDISSIFGSASPSLSTFGSSSSSLYGSSSTSTIGNVSTGLANSNSTMFNTNAENAAKLEEARAKSSQYDDSTVVKLLDMFNNKLQVMSEELANTQIVLDNGVLVGQMVGPMDQALGTRTYRNVRERG